MEIRNFAPKKQALFQNVLDLVENMKIWRDFINRLIINTITFFAILDRL